MRVPLDDDMLNLDESELRRQVEAALAGLKCAGVEWVPKGPPLRRGAVPIVLPAAPIAETIMPPSSLAVRRKELVLLAAEISTCTRCPELASTRTQTVFGVGKPGAEVCFLGEAPGADEDKQGIPFVGAAGNLLNRIISGSGFNREDVYILNILKCRPPGNRPPLPHEVENCSGFLKAQLDLVRPKYIVCLGGTAAKSLLKSTLPLGEIRGRIHEYHGIPVIVTYHPGYLLPHRQPAKKREVWDDMKMLLAKMGRPIPVKKSDGDV